MTSMFEVKQFGVWDINFMGTFMSSYSHKYIFVTMEYVPKWVDAIIFADNKGNNVVSFLKKKIF